MVRGKNSTTRCAITTDLAYNHAEHSRCSPQCRRAQLRHEALLLKPTAITFSAWCVRPVLRRGIGAALDVDYQRTLRIDCFPLPVYPSSVLSCHFHATGDGGALAVGGGGASADDNTGVEMSTAAAASAADAAANQRPLAGKAETLAAPRPRAGLLGPQGRSGAVTAAHDPTPATGSVGQGKESVTAKTGGSSFSAAAGSVPRGDSRPAQAAAGATARPFAPNGRRSPASRKTGGKTETRGRGRSETKARPGGGAAMAGAAGAGAGSGLLDGGGVLNSFQTVDDGRKQPTLQGLNPPSRGVYPLPTSGSKPMDAHQRAFAKAKTDELIALDTSGVYTTPPSNSIGKGKEYAAYTAMIERPIWLNQIRKKIVARDMYRRWV